MAGSGGGQEEIPVPFPRLKMRDLVYFLNRTEVFGPGVHIGVEVM